MDFAPAATSTSPETIATSIDPQAEIQRNTRFNFTVNLADGAFFGLGIGVASFVTVLPLYIATLTDTAVLIGLVLAVHNVGWQLPQLLTAGHVARLPRYRPMVIRMTGHERWPFLFLAILVWLQPTIGTTLTLAITYLLLIWQGIGGGLTATAWQSMIGKVMPPSLRATFYGMQNAIANLFASAGAVASGLILSKIGSPSDFSILFFTCFVAMMISWAFLARTREPATVAVGAPPNQRDFWRSTRDILRKDHNFRWFLVARILSQIALMAVGFFTVYAVRAHDMSEATAGIMTAVMMIGSTLSGPLFGWLADKWSYRHILSISALCATAGAVVAVIAPGVEWFVLVFGLSAVPTMAWFAIQMAFLLEFGTPGERPAYIGLSNTLVAPATLLAPLLGGWLADVVNYEAMFWVAAGAGLVTAFVTTFLLCDPHQPSETPIVNPELVTVGAD